MSTMQALVKTRPGPGLDLVRVPVPEPGPDDVLIRVRRSAICGTDLHIWSWDSWAAEHVRPPLVVGHEFSGHVAAVGGEVRDIAVGAMVSGEGHLVCGRCRNCLAGRRHLCPETRGVGVDRDGAFAEYICLPASNVWVADPRLDLDTLAWFDPLGNATHTALSWDLVGEDVLITGAGPIGCMAVGIARHVGARHIVVTDRNDYRLDLARRLGADRALHVERDELRPAMQELGMKEGFDVAMEMSGAAAALRSAIAHMRWGGRIALLGIQGTAAAIDWNTVIFHSLTLQGIYGREMFETWYKMSAMLLSGLDLSVVLTHRFPIERYAEAFAIMEEGTCGKVLLDWDGA